MSVCRCVICIRFLRLPIFSLISPVFSFSCVRVCFWHLQKKSACFSSPDFLIIFAPGIKSPMKFLLRNVFIIGHLIATWCRCAMRTCSIFIIVTRKKGKLFIAIFQTKQKKKKNKKIIFYLNKLMPMSSSKLCNDSKIYIYLYLCGQPIKYWKLVCFCLLLSFNY